jgi:hypothetical protein
MINANMYEIMRDEEKDMSELFEVLTDILWYIHHPPPLFYDPGVGTDQLRTRPKIELSILLRGAEAIRAELRLLHRSHYDRHGREHRI